METNYNALVGELVHQFMWRQKRSQTDVAAALGIAQSTLSRKLRGERPWEIGELYKLAEILEISIMDLIPNEQNPRPGDDPDGGSSAPSRARTYDLRITRSDTHPHLQAVA